MFKRWSQSNPQIIEELQPKLGFRSWGLLHDEEKQTIWQHLARYFFDANPNIRIVEQRFHGSQIEKAQKQSRIELAIRTLNLSYRKNNYAPTYLANGDLACACEDFYTIFTKQTENVVLELLSIYCQCILFERSLSNVSKKLNESDAAYLARNNKWKYEEFDHFRITLNDVFEQFGVNVILTRQDFVLRQDKKITEEIYEPVLSYLSDPKWKTVNNHFVDAFKNYREKAYSTAITHTVTAIQAYLQLLVYGSVGKGDISKLIPQAQAKSLIPSDSFTTQIFKNMESVFARERQDKGHAHPTIIEPTEANARLLLNLAMVFIQHCMQS